MAPSEFPSPALLALVEGVHAAPVPEVGPAPGGEWQVAPPPPERDGVRVELVVPANDAAELERGLRAGPDALVLDFDDTFSATWANVAAGHGHLPEVARAFGGALMLRPRGLHVPERNVRVGNRVAVAGLFDAAAALHALAPDLRAGRTLTLYLPKLETAQGAARWEGALAWLEAELGLAPQGVRVGLQVETLPGARAVDDLLWALRGRACLLNAGRWDYFASLQRHAPQVTLPERARMTFDQPYLGAYARLIAGAAARRGAGAVGGTAALVPDPGNPAPVLERVRADKRLEARLGYAAAWAGHPDLVPTVREVFAAGAVVDPGPPVLPADLTAVPGPGPISVDAVRENIDLSVTYLERWAGGCGNLVRQGRLEDLATVEFARTQLWTWVNREVELDDGRLTPTRYLSLRRERGGGEAGGWLDALTLAPECPAYFQRELAGVLPGRE